MDHIDALEKARISEMRWRILRLLDAARPNSASEQLIQIALEDIELEATLMGLRRELDYLEKKELIEICDRKERVWKIELTALGIDVIEGKQACPPGIRRRED